MAVDLTGSEAQTLASVLHSIRANCEKELKGEEIAPGMKMPPPDKNRAAYLAEVVHVCNKVLAGMLNNPPEQKSPGGIITPNS